MGGRRRPPGSELTRAPRLASRQPECRWSLYCAASLSRISSALSKFKAASSFRRVSQSRCHGTPRPCWLSSGVSGGKASVVRGVWGSYLNKGHCVPSRDRKGLLHTQDLSKLGELFSMECLIGCWSGLLPCWEDISANSPPWPLWLVRDMYMRKPRIKEASAK